MIEITGPYIMQGGVKIQGDKSISHRSVIISAISGKKVRIENFLFSQDCINTINLIKKLGININRENDLLVVEGKRIGDLKEPDDVLFVGNSGTTIRLVAGLLSAAPFMSILTGDPSINKRPMKRIIKPLNRMGARVYGRDGNTKAPLVIIGEKRLKALKHNITVASAQVKSSLILASLFSDGKTEINQPAVSRDHTERMLEYFEAGIRYDGRKTIITPEKIIKGKDIFVPNDISSAAYFIVAALILRNSRVILKDIGINPTRSYFLDVLREMGGKISIKNKRVRNNEEIADIECQTSNLQAVKIGSEKIPNIIDEIPILAVAAAYAKGVTEITGAHELRYKESDRLNSITQEFDKAGIEVKEKPDGLVIKGDNHLKLKDTTFDSHMDHRIAMSLIVLSLPSEAQVMISDTECIKTSFPDFIQILYSVLKKERT
jgi:3-phosphoshikimate 1-carboxyvinyltransferase